MCVCADCERERAMNATKIVEEEKYGFDNEHRDAVLIE
jgi:hypothetical protein